MTTTPHYETNVSDPPAPRRVRWKLALAVVLLAAVAVVYIQVTESIEGNFRFPFTMLALAGMFFLLAVWLLLFSGLPWQRRLTWLGLEVALVVLPIVFLRFTTRMQGSYTGAGVPRLVWKWTPPPDAALAAQQNTAPHAVAPAAQAPVDLVTTTPQDSPEFLGPGRQNAMTGVSLSHDWSTHPPRELWRRAVGVGWGSFAVVNGFAITQEQIGGRELTTCLDARTGTPRWQHENAVRFSEGMGGDGPRATPTVVGGRVYVMGATGILDCLDGATGNAIWSRNVLSDLKAPNEIWGKSASPLVYERFVVVTGGAASGASLAAYDKETGAPLWHAGSDAAAYGSAALATVAGKRQVMILNAHSATGHDAQTGAVLWTYEWPGNWPKVSQVVPFDGDRVLISAGYGLGSIMLHLAPTAGGGDALTATPVWTNLRLKTEFTNVAVRDGFIYGLDDGVLACLDASTGKRRWRDGRYGHGQILRADDLLIVQTEPGPVALVEAKPDGFTELGTIPALSSKTWNNPALYGHLLLVRNDREAVCYELP